MKFVDVPEADQSSHRGRRSRDPKYDGYVAQIEDALKRLADAGLVARVPEPESYRLGPSAEKLPLATLREQIGAERLPGFHGMVLSDPGMREIADTIRRIGSTPGIIESILIYGESGTGKELVARALHFANSMRRYGPFVAINCANIPASLFEAELFGIESGAATGVAKRAGLFEIANGGTVFLDEITEMERSLQPKLLRVLEERAVQRIGASAPSPINVQIIAATNRNPSNELEAGGLRRDIYHRLASFEMRIPPLRERQDDISEIARHFLGELQDRSGIKMTIENEGMDLLCKYAWPGNVRELQQVLRRAAIATSGRITRDVIERQLPLAPASKPTAPSAPSPENAFRVHISDDRLREVELHYRVRGEKITLKSIVEKVESELCEATRSQTSSALQAATVLGLSPQGMLNKIKRYGLKSNRRSKG